MTKIPGNTSNRTEEMRRILACGGEGERSHGGRGRGETSVGCGFHGALSPVNVPAMKAPPGNPHPASSSRRAAHASYPTAPSSLWVSCISGLCSGFTPGTGVLAVSAYSCKSTWASRGRSDAAPAGAQLLGQGGSRREEDGRHLILPSSMGVKDQSITDGLKRSEEAAAERGPLCACWAWVGRFIMAASASACVSRKVLLPEALLRRHGRAYRRRHQDGGRM